MINEFILSGSENISNVHKANLGPRLKGVSRPKGNALGDVRNTLHSRTPANTPAAKQVLQKENIVRKNCKDENAFPGKKVSSARKPKSAASEVKKSIMCSPTYDNLEFHNHNLCEQADETCFKSLMSDYKLSENEIESLVAHIKPVKFSIPQTRTVQLLTPCEDIEIVENCVWEDRNSPESDDSFVLPEISPPELL